MKRLLWVFADGVFSIGPSESVLRSRVARLHDVIYRLPMRLWDLAGRTYTIDSLKPHLPAAIARTGMKLDDMPARSAERRRFFLLFDVHLERVEQQADVRRSISPIIRIP